MDALVHSAENVLRRHSAPALRLSELLGHVRADTGVRNLDAERLRGVLEARPDRFRLLDPWRGPWRFVRRGATATRGVDPWVVVVGDPGDAGGAEGGRPPADRRLTASVRWLGLSLDAASGRAVSRWHRMAVASDRARLALAKRAA